MTEHLDYDWKTVSASALITGPLTISEYKRGPFSWLSAPLFWLGVRLEDIGGAIASGALALGKGKLVSEREVSAEEWARHNFLTVRQRHAFYGKSYFTD